MPFEPNAAPPPRPRSVALDEPFHHPHLSNRERIKSADFEIRFSTTTCYLEVASRAALCPDVVEVPRDTLLNPIDRVCQLTTTYIAAKLNYLVNCTVLDRSHLEVATDDIMQQDLPVTFQPSARGCLCLETVGA